MTLAELGSSERPVWLSDAGDIGYLNLGADSKLQYPGAARRLARFIEDERVDILHTHLFYSGIVGVLAKRRYRGFRFALMRHHTGVVRMLGSAVHIRADRWMAEKADHVMAVSEATRTYMLEIDGIRRRDIEVVYLGFDFEQMSPNPEKRNAAREKFGFSDNDLVIGYVANFTAGKGHVQLISAFDEIKRQVPNARLLLAGGGKLQEVEDLVGRLGLGRRIVFAGWQDDAAAVYNAMDIFVQPSLSEAFSQVLIEAMGCGLPVVATDVGGASEVIEPGVDGIIVEPDDARAIAAEVIGLALDPERRCEIAKRGMSRVRGRFSAAAMVERHFALYSKWLGDR